MSFSNNKRSDFVSEMARFKLSREIVARKHKCILRSVSGKFDIKCLLIHIEVVIMHVIFAVIQVRNLDVIDNLKKLIKVSVFSLLNDIHIEGGGDAINPILNCPSDSLNSNQSKQYNLLNHIF